MNNYKKHNEAVKYMCLTNLKDNEIFFIVSRVANAQKAETISAEVITLLKSSKTCQRNLNKTIQ